MRRVATALATAAALVLMTPIAPPARASDGAMEVLAIGPAKMVGNGDNITLPVRLRCVRSSLSAGVYYAIVTVRQQTGPRVVTAERVMVSTECDGVARTFTFWMRGMRGDMGAAFRPGRLVASVYAFQPNFDNTLVERRVSRFVVVRPAQARGAGTAGR